MTVAVDPFPYWMKDPSEKVMERLKKIVQMVTTTMTVRRITYMLFPGVHGKKLENAYNNTIKDVVRVRIRGLLPWRKIRESRCEFVDSSGYDDVDDFFYYQGETGEELANRYRKTRRPAHKQKILVWFEKDTVEQEFKSVCRKYHVPLVCGRGQPTWSIKKKMADHMTDENYLVLYCGDNDLKGHEIKDVIERDLKYMGCNAKVEWVMVTEDMESEYDLSEEARLDDFDLGDLKKVLEDVILKYIDKKKLKEIDDAEKGEKRKISRYQLIVEEYD